MRTLISMVPLLSGCLLTDEQYEIKYEEFFADSVEADTAVPLMSPSLHCKQ